MHGIVVAARYADASAFVDVQVASQAAIEQLIVKSVLSQAQAKGKGHDQGTKPTTNDSHTNTSTGEVNIATNNNVNKPDAEALRVEAAALRQKAECVRKTAREEARVGNFEAAKAARDEAVKIAAEASAVEAKALQVANANANANANSKTDTDTDMVTPPDAHLGKEKRVVSKAADRDNDNNDNNDSKKSSQQRRPQQSAGQSALHRSRDFGPTLRAYLDRAEDFERR